MPCLSTVQRRFANRQVDLLFHASTRHPSGGDATTKMGNPTSVGAATLWGGSIKSVTRLRTGPGQGPSSNEGARSELGGHSGQTAAPPAHGPRNGVPACCLAHLLRACE